MAGWTYTGAVRQIRTAATVEDGEKTNAFPALGATTQAGWWQDFAWKVGQEFTLECKTRQTNVATVKVSANNSSGDTLGVGTLTITFVTT